MVTKPKAKRTSKRASKRPAKAEELPRPDFEKGMKYVQQFARDNVEWLKMMANR